MLSAARIAQLAGGSAVLVAAALAHDLVEDTATDLAAISEVAGPDVAWIVAALSEDPTLPDYRARKAALRASVAAGRSRSCSRRRSWPAGASWA